MMIKNGVLILIGIFCLLFLGLWQLGLWVRKNDDKIEKILYSIFVILIGFIVAILLYLIVNNKL